MPLSANRVAGHRPHARWTGIFVGVLIWAATAPFAVAEPKVHMVIMEALKYAPPVIEVAAGDTVVWTNKDPFPHTVTAENRRFDSGGIAPNHSWKFKTKEKGIFPYVCTFHPTMKGRLVVK
jgi:plastocyanin